MLKYSGDQRNKSESIVGMGKKWVLKREILLEPHTGWIWISSHSPNSWKDPAWNTNDAGQHTRTWAVEYGSFGESLTQVRMTALHCETHRDIADMAADSRPWEERPEEQHPVAWPGSSNRMRETGGRLCILARKWEAVGDDGPPAGWGCILWEQGNLGHWEPWDSKMSRQHPEPHASWHKYNHHCIWVSVGHGPQMFT